MRAVDLERRRILVVEDELLLALDIAAEIEGHNGIVIGPANTLDMGFELLRDETPDACICNITLHGVPVYPLADALLEKGVPFVFASAEERDSIPLKYRKVPLHRKPIEMIAVAAGLMGGPGEA